MFLQVQVREIIKIGKLLPGELLQNIRPFVPSHQQFAGVFFFLEHFSLTSLSNSFSGLLALTGNEIDPSESRAGNEALVFLFIFIFSKKIHYIIGAEKELDKSFLPKMLMHLLPCIFFLLFLRKDRASHLQAVLYL